MERSIAHIGQFSLFVSTRDSYGFLLFVIRKNGELYDALAGDSDSDGYRIALGNLKRYARDSQ